VFPGGKGRALKSDDIIYSLKRFASVQNVKSYSLMQGTVAGMDDFRKATSTGGDINKLEIAGLKKVDDTHFTMTLTSPNPLALFRSRPRRPQSSRAKPSSITKTTSRTIPSAPGPTSSRTCSAAV